MARPTPQEIQDIRDQAKIDAAYEKSLRMTEPAPAAKPAASAASGAKKMAKGGSASSRADGCACKGKTRGKIV